MINDSEYIDLLVQLVQSATSPERPYVTAAALGETLQRAVSDQSWKDFGYRSLGELLRSSKVAAHLNLIRTEKGALAVAVRSGDPTALSPASAGHKYNSLKQAVWGAFVMATPAGKRFLNRKTGAVRAGLMASPTPLDEWIEIHPISPETQKLWATQFLDTADFEVTAEVREALLKPNWNHLFTVALGPKGAEWNRRRSCRVSELADKWASESGVPHDVVFQSRITQPSPINKSDSLIRSSLETDRELILAAIAMLPMEKLREIVVPAGAIIDAMRGR
ncbi:OST-HTH/LOTUS domain-containing protein [Xanthomonas campestris pv. campestris]|uniref:OST-HTH/LOTUS domain-containing protein n=1 Tax=Xanthomonas campestris TaxID=339 RepID=UPI001F1C592B|nr:OST-HTH/LOTUS domain-containing protein [Xanthomonas campestris]MCF8839705.1 OST-HTH/LOTUS domain-containing protein [Xanthomonas campestris pv. campestris]MDO0882883.1 OST-HTH/LOTUS domain-containing protein [Xanthomonas campestris pv. campestris]MEA0635305.1 OST-HTH/LOTUS domain-containing protein [Xanthomonas campestris pv. campestris]MEA0651697.1 OST-HTH/LOTUS domain-containing protein [Xanthomonas campestris pv. campestris]MEA0655777.1 OST-HTH/LOTUS domain-containing protein [Xanthomon